MSLVDTVIPRDRDKGETLINYANPGSPSGTSSSTKNNKQIGVNEEGDRLEGIITQYVL